MADVYPFSAIVGQTALKRALMMAAVDPAIGGVLVFGDRGTGKSTAVRALAGLLPPIRVVRGCPFHCDPQRPSACASDCGRRDASGHATNTDVISTPVVDLPLGATEDRVVGALDLEHALTRGEKRFEPGLLARANRGFLYIDEINLLEDNLVDLLLDVSASGENLVEREGLSVRHPSRFVLVGSGNPEEGELRPQLLDRFGLSVEVRTPTVLAERVEVIKRRAAFDHDPAAFVEVWAEEQARLSRLLVTASQVVSQLPVPDSTLEASARLCIAIGSDGLRGELTLMRAARAAAALEGADEVRLSHVREVAPMALGHRMRRDPLDEGGSAVRIERAMLEVFDA